MQISFAVTAKLISAFVFATLIVQFLYFLNPKFQAFSYFLGQYNFGLCRTWSDPENRFSDISAHMMILFCLFSASLGTLSPATHPQLPPNPYLRPGGPPNPFFHPVMPPMMGRVPPGGPPLMLPTSQAHSLIQPQPPPPKADPQVSIIHHLNTVNLEMFART